MALTQDDKIFIKDLYSQLQLDDRKYLDKSMKQLQLDDRKYLDKSMKQLQLDDRKYLRILMNELRIEDRKVLKILLEDVVDQKVEEKIKEFVGNLPTKEEFNKRMDELMGEIKTIREEQALLSQHSSDHSDKLECLEKIHPKNSHDHLFA